MLSDAAARGRDSSRGRLEGKVVLVTGGGRGIGRAIALRLASEGGAIVVTGRGERGLGETVGEIVHAGGRARHVVGDVRDGGHLAQAVARACEVFGALDIVVANAGVSGRTPLDPTAEAGPGAPAVIERAREILDTNLLGTLFTFRAGLERLRDGGRLIAISSVLAKFGVAGYAAYCASKAGVLGLVRALALEVAPRGITCNAVVPGWVETDMAEAGLREIGARLGASPVAVRADAEKAVPLGRFIEPEEVAALVAFLCSDEAGAITGQALSICGGATAFGG